MLLLMLFNVELWNSAIFPFHFHVSFFLFFFFSFHSANAVYSLLLQLAAQWTTHVRRERKRTVVFGWQHKKLNQRVWVENGLSLRRHIHSLVHIQTHSSTHEHLFKHIWTHGGPIRELYVRETVICIKFVRFLLPICAPFDMNYTANCQRWR